MKTRRTISGLYAITPDTADTEWLSRRVAAALEGNASVLQYRNKTASPELAREQLTALLPLCRERGVALIVNDDPALALAVDADGVHLGRDDGRIAEARAALGPKAIIGVSCYNELARARQAVSEGADYVAFGSFYPSAIKPDAVHASEDLLRRARAEIALSIVAIGGIQLHNAAALVRAGADAIAVISALFDEADTRTAARAFSDLFQPMPAVNVP